MWGKRSTLRLAARWSTALGLRGERQRSEARMLTAALGVGCGGGITRGCTRVALARVTWLCVRGLGGLPSYDFPLACPNFVCVADLRSREGFVRSVRTEETEWRRLVDSVSGSQRVCAGSVYSVRWRQKVKRLTGLERNALVWYRVAVQHVETSGLRAGRVRLRASLAVTWFGSWASIRFVRLPLSVWGLAVNLRWPPPLGP